MHVSTQRLSALFAALLLPVYSLLAQAEGESPYSSSTVDAPPGGNFFNTYGVVIAVVAIFLILLLFVVFRGRRRA